jgi:hypothetical protein
LEVSELAARVAGAFPAEQQRARSIAWGRSTTKRQRSGGEIAAWCLVLFAALATVALGARAKTIPTQRQLDAEPGTACAAQGKAAACIRPARISDPASTMVASVDTGIAAAGSSQATATALTSQISIVTSVAAGTGVVLPTPVVGEVLYVSNQGGNNLLVYPPAGVAIDAHATNDPAMVARNAAVELIAVTGTQFNTIVQQPWTTAVYTGTTTPLTLAGINYLEEVINQTTPAAITINLPMGPVVGQYLCVKDGGNDFAMYPAQISTIDGSTIEGGSNGYLMAKTNEEACFMYVGGAKWIVK